MENFYLAIRGNQLPEAEGSLLWMNVGNVDRVGSKAFKDQAMKQNTLNENRFGWGATMGI